MVNTIIDMCRLSDRPLPPSGIAAEHVLCQVHLPNKVAGIRLLDTPDFTCLGGEVLHNIMEIVLRSFSDIMDPLRCCAKTISSFSKEMQEKHVKGKLHDCYRKFRIAMLHVLRESVHVGGVHGDWHDRRKDQQVIDDARRKCAPVVADAFADGAFGDVVFQRLHDQLGQCLDEAGIFRQVMIAFRDLIGDGGIGLSADRRLPFMNVCDALAQQGTQAN